MAAASRRRETRQSPVKWNESEASLMSRLKCKGRLKLKADSRDIMSRPRVTSTRLLFHFRSALLFYHKLEVSPFFNRRIRKTCLTE